MYFELIYWNSLVYAVLYKDIKIKEFLEKELPACGREQAAERIRVAVFKDQTYTPILGESPKVNPQICWDEQNPFLDFSYNLLNQKRGFFMVQKKLPPLMLYCEQRKYFMLRLKLSSPGNPPEDHIYSYGREIDPTPCSKYIALQSSIEMMNQNRSSLLNMEDSTTCDIPEVPSTMESNYFHPENSNPDGYTVERYI